MFSSSPAALSHARCGYGHGSAKSAWVFGCLRNHISFTLLIPCQKPERRIHHRLQQLTLWQSSRRWTDDLTLSKGGLMVSTNVLMLSIDVSPQWKSNSMTALTPLIGVSMQLTFSSTAHLIASWLKVNRFVHRSTEQLEKRVATLTSPAQACVGSSRPCLTSKLRCLATSGASVNDTRHLPSRFPSLSNEPTPAVPSVLFATGSIGPEAERMFCSRAMHRIDTHLFLSEPNLSGLHSFVLQLFNHVSERKITT